MSSLPRKRATPRTFKTPRCKRQRCNKRPEIAGLCISHAMKAADDRFQGGVRERDGVCTGMGVLPNACNGHLQAAHIVRRGSYSVRYDPLNCHALCEGHHMLVDNTSQAIWYRWAVSRLGEEGFRQLMERAAMEGNKRAAIEEALAA